MKKKLFRRILWGILIVFLSCNLMAYFHAYRFTHFDETLQERPDPSKMLITDKMLALISGIPMPRPSNQQVPVFPYQTLVLQSNKKIECWEISVENSKGVIAIFHGYNGSKSTMLDKAYEFRTLGYSTFLVDFMGSGGSEGNETTVGYAEAEQVKTCFDFLQNRGEKTVYLFGTSLGAVAIMKAVHDFSISPSGLLLECPFGSMYETTCARFRSFQVPEIPLAGMLVFWGGVQHNFWAFSHNPAEYANAITVPTLLLYGEKDDRVSRHETDQIYESLQGRKRLRCFPEAGHENYLRRYREEWTAEIKDFLLH